MADIQPTKSQKTKAKAPAPEKEPEEVENLTPQEMEARKAAEDAKAEEKRQANIEKLVKSKKYYLPIK